MTKAAKSTTTAGTPKSGDSAVHDRLARLEELLQDAIEAKEKSERSLRAIKATNVGECMKAVKNDHYYFGRYGNRLPVANWIVLVAKLLKSFSIKEDTMASMLVVSQLLRGQALVWFQAEEKSDPDKYKSFAEFKPAILEQFSSEHDRFIMRERMANTKQGVNENVHSYIARMETAFLDVSNADPDPMSDSEKLNYFLLGLTFETRKKCYESNVFTYEQAKNIAKLYGQSITTSQPGTMPEVNNVSMYDRRGYGYSGNRGGYNGHRGGYNGRGRGEYGGKNRSGKQHNNYGHRQQYYQ